MNSNKVNYKDLISSFELSTAGAYYAVTTQKEARARLKELKAAVDSEICEYAGYLRATNLGMDCQAYANLSALCDVIRIIGDLVRTIDNKQKVNGAKKTLADLNQLYTNLAVYLSAIPVISHIAAADHASIDKEING